MTAGASLRPTGGFATRRVRYSGDGRWLLTEVIWDPDDRKPLDATALESEIRRVAPEASVKLTLAGDVWRVRALAPAALCTRGPGLSGRDLSGTVAEALNDSGSAVLFETPPLRKG
jgi:hypothetical protein